MRRFLGGLHLVIQLHKTICAKVVCGFDYPGPTHRARIIPKAQISIPPNRYETMQGMEGRYFCSHSLIHPLNINTLATEGSTRRRRGRRNGVERDCGGCRCRCLVPVRRAIWGVWLMKGESTAFDFFEERIRGLGALLRWRAAHDR